MGFWFSVNTSNDESRKHNSKAMSILLSALPDSMKSNIGWCSYAKHIWESIQNIHAGQDHVGKEESHMEYFDNEK